MEIPGSWVRTALDDLIVYVLGGDWGKAPELIEDGYEPVYCIRGAEFKNWDSEKGETASLRVVKSSSLISRKLKENDILVEISGGGPEQPVGRTVLIDKTSLSFHAGKPKICTNFLRLIRPSINVRSAYINYYLQFFYKSGEIVKYQAGSNNLRNLKFKDYIAISVPVPSLSEQNRIIEKVEELFSELDKGIESLKTARNQLKVYRQALLKHAFEGKLTEQWRAKQGCSSVARGQETEAAKDNANKLDTADQLLLRIQEERETRYKQQLDEWNKAVKKWEASSKEGKKSSKPKTIKILNEFTDDENKQTFNIPTSWSWVKIGNVAVVGTGVTPLKSRADFYEGGDVAWVTSGALNEPFVKKASANVTKLALEETNLKTYPPHTLLMAMYGEGKTRGKCAELLIPATTNQAIAAIVQTGVEEKTRSYLKWFMHKNYIDIRRKSSGGVQPNLNLGIVENTAFPLCPPNEMDVIVEMLEQKLSIVDDISYDIDSQLKKSEALRQSILKKAFSGQLVPQDSNDEPASELLKRIAIEKSDAEEKIKADKAATKKTTLKKKKSKKVAQV